MAAKLGLRRRKYLNNEINIFLRITIHDVIKKDNKKIDMVFRTRVGERMKIETTRKSDSLPPYSRYNIGLLAVLFKV